MATSTKIGFTEVHGQRRLESPTKSGSAIILIREMTPGRFDVTILDGHDLLPGTQRGLTEAAARSYANTVWATR